MKEIKAIDSNDPAKFKNKKILYQIYEFENSLEKTYNNKEIEFFQWKINFITQKNNILILVDKSDKIILYSRYIFDKKFNNLYIRNVSVTEDYQSNLGVSTFYFRYMIKKFIESDVDYLRLSTSKKNKKVISMLSAHFQFTKNEKHDSTDYYTYSLKKDDLYKNKRIQRMLRRKDND